MMLLLFIVHAAFVRTEVGSVAELSAEWSLKDWLNEQGKEIGKGFVAMHGSIEKSASDVQQALKEAADLNGNGTVTSEDYTFTEIKKKASAAGHALSTKVAAATAALDKVAKEIEAKIDSDGDGSVDMKGVKEAFHRSVEETRESLTQMSASVRHALDRDRDGSHSAADLDAAGTEAVEAYKALDARLRQGIEGMITTISTMTWDNDSSDEDQSVTPLDEQVAVAHEDAVLLEARARALPPNMMGGLSGLNFGAWAKGILPRSKTMHCIVGDECWSDSGFTFVRLNGICENALDRGATEVKEGNCWNLGYECKEPGNLASYTLGLGMGTYRAPKTRHAGGFFECDGPEFDGNRVRKIHGDNTPEPLMGTKPEAAPAGEGEANP